jgi:2-dehydro-3-deoxygalactonokinase
MSARMRWADGYIAVDWGTTNRRAYRLDSWGRCIDEFEDEKGVLSVPAGGFLPALAEIRERLGDFPLLLAGMIGSNRGWHEAGYVPAPAGIDEIAAAVMWAGEREAIVPGVSYIGQGRADVMRGEEVQLLGAVAAGHVPADALVSHPGTHNKWVKVEASRIARFRTVMTGELYNLLKAHSILSDLLQTEAEPDDAFRRGCDHGLAHDDFASELFAVRARVLLGEAPREAAASYTSGLLIGSDVRIGIEGHERPRIYVMGRPELTRLYAEAIRQAGGDAVELDGEQSFLAGIHEVAKRI